MSGPLGAVDVSCPECGEPVHVEVVADTGVIVNGELLVKLSTRYEHECLP